MSRYVVRTALSSACFLGGFATLARPWPENTPQANTVPLNTQSAAALAFLNQHPDFTQLSNHAVSSPEIVEQLTYSKRIAKLHQSYHVGFNLLYGPNHLEIDPIVFINKELKELTAFYHLGANLVSAEDGKIHLGLLSTLIDESLCSTGFPYLPSKRGVTAKLLIDFKTPVEPNTTIMVKARVTELKGRKCVIEGSVYEVGEPESFADAVCVLVEPKWFKYVTKLQAFG